LNFADELGMGDLRFAVQAENKWWLTLNEANQIGSSAILTKQHNGRAQGFRLRSVFRHRKRFTF
jgi:hypothetical protein